ncbi:hypothetical protein HPP92_024550 [Vanilla planifolia]|uniref:Uncharacterized protein n=1 Tax=Vanilla planifolia TaxID=51239 RepID=A0A835UBL0_VANPL|nr:hypothetical protein HPP92_024550 [Vanilla planifolia]
MHCFVDLLNDILAARSPVGSNISSEASVTFIDVGLVQSLTKTLDVLDLDHSDSAKIVSGVVKALELVTREYVHSSGINSAKGNSSNLPSDQNQADSNISGDRFQSLETTLHSGHSEAAVEHMEPFGLAQTPRSSDDMDHEQDLDVSFARDTEDDFMHETSEEGGVLENGISTVEITFELPHNASEGLGDEDEDDDMSEDGDGDEVEEDEVEDEDEDQNNDLEEDDVQMLHPDTDHDDHEIEDEEFDEDVLEEEDEDDEEFDEDVLEEEDEDDEGVILRLEEGVNGMNVFDHIEVFSGGNNFPGGALLLGRRQEFAASMSNRLVELMIMVLILSTLYWWIHLLS